MKGIVTKQTDYGEGNRLLSIFTAEYGIIKVSCRGAGRTKGKNTAMSQFLCYGEFTTFGSSDIPLLDTSVPIDNFFPLQEDIKKLALASYFSDAVFGFLGLNNPDVQMYRLFLNSIYALSYKELEPETVKTVFEARLAAAAGYMPQLLCCSGCGDTEDASYFDIVKGEVFCADCRRAGSVRISRAARAAFSYIGQCDIKKIFSFSADAELIGELGRITEKYLMNHLGYIPESLDYYKKI